MTKPRSQPPQDDRGDLVIPGREQRQHPRVVYRDPVQVHLIGVPHDLHPRALLAEDLSASGLALSSPELFGVGTRLMMDLQPQPVGAPIRLLGRVIWVAHIGLQHRYRLGVQFQDLSDEARLALRQLLAERSPAP